MSGAVSLRPVGPGDEPWLYRIYASTREAELAPLGWDAAQQTAFLTQQFTAQARYYQEHYRDTTFDLILCGGEPAGRLYVARWPDEIRIVDIALLPPYRNQGLGSAFLRALQEEATQAGKPLRIHVEVFNPARRLYERLGFTQIADRGVYHFLEWRPSPPGPLARVTGEGELPMG